MITVLIALTDVNTTVIRASSNKEAIAQVEWWLQKNGLTIIDQIDMEEDEYLCCVRDLLSIHQDHQIAFSEALFTKEGFQ